MPKWRQTHNTWHQDAFVALGDVAGTGTGDSGETGSGFLDLRLGSRESLALLGRDSSDGPDPTGIGVDNTATDSGALSQAELLSSLLAQSVANRLTGGQDQTVLAWNTAELLEIVLDNLLKTWNVSILTDRW